MEKHRDPIQGEFFTTESIDSIADSVVRESIQNSLDAKAANGDEPIEVRFTVGRVPMKSASSFFEGLWPHVAACDKKAGALEKDKDVRFLTVEDFGTTGLRGDPAQMFEAESSDPPNEFYYFVRAEGRSSKSGADRGNWGVGKYTYPMVSRINSFLALTNRIPDCGPGGQGPLAIGQAVLKNHRRGEQHYQPDGWWALVKEEGDDRLPLPFDGSNGDVPGDLASAFLMDRHDEPGLSVVVPFIDDELDAGEILRSVIRNYGIAIAWGLLAVSVKNEKGEITKIDAALLDEVVAGLAKAERDRFQSNLELARWGASCADEDRVVLNEFDGRPSWNAEGLMDEEAATRIREDLAAGQNVCVRVPVHVDEKSGGLDEWSFMDVLFAPIEGTKEAAAFYREGLRISEAGGSKITGIRSIVVVDDPPLAQMLGDAEGPAHVNWSPSTRRFKDKYADGKRWIGFVKQAPQEILRLARSAQEDEDRDLAKDYFSDHDRPPPPPPPDPEGEKEKEGDGDDPPPPPPPPPPPNVRESRVEEIEGGFTASVGEAVRSGSELRLKVAYDVRKGSALKKWRPWDFRLENMEISCEGGLLVEADGQLMRVRVDEPERFKVRVRGFDTNRDLYVDDDVEVAP